eukprot:TRINITY_DN36381_c0_g1_i1.p1 TRINITY_DN36381_c0_g1~~TRINITY_DN36381_c0_g1_i1.p1  ORF type:complete len:412 (-),score=80.37 TRINITY_DN36381_c0_g1_i1:261-1496(-)
MALYPIRGMDALFILFRPTLLQRWLPQFFGARPETNRGALRDVLLESFSDSPNISVHYDTGVYDVQPSDGGKAELFGKDRSSLGVFDLVVDGMGVHSPIRHHRVDDPSGKIRTGELVIHGVIDDPESSFGPELLERLGLHGSLFVVSQGYLFFIQRFGAGADDNRTSFFYMVPSDEETLYAELGFEQPTTRDGGIMRDELRLGRIKEWILNDMGDRFDPMYKDAVTSLNRASARSWVTHGTTTLRPDVSLPLLCIGDSQRNCGLGAGGILAMRDCVELAALLEDEGVLDPDLGLVGLPRLREAEVAMMARKVEAHAELTGMRSGIIERRPDGDTTLGWGLVVKSAVGQFFARNLMPTISRWWNAWYRYDFRHGQAGSTGESPIYPGVKAVLDESPPSNPNPKWEGWRRNMF